MTRHHTRNATWPLLLACLATGATAAAADTPGDSAASPGLDEVLVLLKQQQQELQAQRRLLEAQEERIRNLTRELDSLRAHPPMAQDSTVAAATAPPPATARPSDAAAAPDSTATAGTVATAAAPPPPTTPESQQDKARATGESIAEARTDDPTRALLEDFRGAWRLPGTDAALAIGGYVKTAVVYNNDPLSIKDRFIVGSIPVDVSDDVEAQASITASQSRLNFDLREPTEYGVLRAFIEGDFAEDDDTFRLRHAFGQWRTLLAGKTWSTFVDTGASPEEVDFEGLNARVNVRQSQFRFMPSLGKEYEFQFSLEDPNPQVQNGSGVTRAPDLVAAARFQPRERLHLRAAVLGRQIRAQRLAEDGGGVEKSYGWGLSLSGRYSTPRFDARDNLLFQLNRGDGIGRYINDLSSVGQFDGIVDPSSGDLELFEVISAYVSLQHWWGVGQLRSNFTLGAVEVDNPGFVEGDAYRRTIRASTNLIWSPTPRIDVGGEYLWGRRENEDGDEGDASQVQLGLRYRF